MKTLEIIAQSHTPNELIHAISLNEVKEQAKVERFSLERKQKNEKKAA